jgi:hypothetical protein
MQRTSEGPSKSATPAYKSLRVVVHFCHHMHIHTTPTLLSFGLWFFTLNID